MRSRGGEGAHHHHGILASSVKKNIVAVSNVTIWLVITKTSCVSLKVTVFISPSKVKLMVLLIA